MTMRLARLFQIKTRTEVWLVIYALSLGAVERGRHYMEIYPGNGGLMLALACTGVVFLAGAKLLDSVEPAAATAKSGIHGPLERRRPAISRSRPRVRPSRFGSESRFSLRRDSRPTIRP
jgi:hypothetical protein